MSEMVSLPTATIVLTTINCGKYCRRSSGGV